MSNPDKTYEGRYRYVGPGGVQAQFRCHECHQWFNINTIDVHPLFCSLECDKVSSARLRLSDESDLLPRVTITDATTLWIKDE